MITRTLSAPRRRVRVRGVDVAGSVLLSAVLPMVPVEPEEAVSGCPVIDEFDIDQATGTSVGFALPWTTRETGGADFGGTGYVLNGVFVAVSENVITVPD